MKTFKISWIKSRAIFTTQTMLYCKFINLSNTQGTVLTNTQKLTSYQNFLSPGRQISTEFWVFNVQDGSPLLEIKNGGMTIVTVSVSGNDYVLTWLSTSSVLTFTDMASNTPSNSWSMIGVSIGWDGNGNNGGMACVYTFGTAELFNCYYRIAINYLTDLSNSNTYTFEYL